MVWKKYTNDSIKKPEISLGQYIRSAEQLKDEITKVEEPKEVLRRLIQWQVDRDIAMIATLSRIEDAIQNKIMVPEEEIGKNLIQFNLPKEAVDRMLSQKVTDSIQSVTPAPVSPATIAPVVKKPSSPFIKPLEVDVTQRMTLSSELADGSSCGAIPKNVKAVAKSEWLQ